jgi:hypothetical protein
MNRAQHWCAITGVALAISGRSALAQQPVPPCDPAAIDAVAKIQTDAKTWRKEAFGAFRRRLVNADLAASTPASDPLIITGGLNDDKTTAKVQAAFAFAGSGTVSWSGSLSSDNVKSINVFDPLQAATDYSTKLSVSWSQWKNVLGDGAALRVAVCKSAERRGQLQPEESRESRTSALVAEQKARVVVEQPIVGSVSYEIGRTTFAFADPKNDYEKVTEQHRAQTINAIGGYVMSYGSSSDENRPITTFLITYQRRWGYVDGTDTTQFYCHPILASTASACDTTPLPGAPPKSKPGNLWQFDIRHFFSWPISPGLRITRNAVADFDTFEAPVYFISKDADTLFSFTGGVTAGYRDGGNAKGRFVAIFFGTIARPGLKKHKTDSEHVNSRH